MGGSIMSKRPLFCKHTTNISAYEEYDSVFMEGVWNRPLSVVQVITKGRRCGRRIHTETFICMGDGFEKQRSFWSLI